jgi:hypothetical protein
MLKERWSDIGFAGVILDDGAIPLPALCGPTAQTNDRQVPRFWTTSGTIFRNSRVC